MPVLATRPARRPRPSVSLPSLTTLKAFTTPPRVVKHLRATPPAVPTRRPVRMHSMPILPAATTQQTVPVRYKTTQPASTTQLLVLVHSLTTQLVAATSHWVLTPVHVLPRALTISTLPTTVLLAKAVRSASGRQ